MNISSDYSVTGNNYEVRKISSANSKPFSIPDDAPHPVSKRDNFLQEYVKGDKEEDEDEEDGRLVDYLLAALKGEEKELRAEGNSYMDDEERKKFLKGHCPELFKDLE
ncbi:MAG: hypothetical protein LBC75_00425 [Fibromonadaceae bacterium]|jgi:hypothetical protein|nr:hypothetical protein [Fibromonadaceae bacterium]